MKRLRCVLLTVLVAATLMAACQRQTVVVKEGEPMHISIEYFAPAPMYGAEKTKG